MCYAGHLENLQATETLALLLDAKYQGLLGYRNAKGWWHRGLDVQWHLQNNGLLYSSQHQLFRPFKIQLLYLTGLWWAVVQMALTHNYVSSVRGRKWILQKDPWGIQDYIIVAWEDVDNGLKCSFPYMLMLSNNFINNQVNRLSHSCFIVRNDRRSFFDSIHTWSVALSWHCASQQGLLEVQ